MERNRSNLLLMKNQTLAEEMGHFETDNPSRTYVRQVVDYGANSWRFRIQLPVGEKYKLGVGTIGILEDGQPDFSLATTNQGNFSTDEFGLGGQFNLQISISKLGQTWCVHVAEFGQHHQTHSINFEEKHINGIFGQLITNTSKFSGSGNAYGKHGNVADFSSDEPIVLFRSHHGGKKPVSFRNTQLEEVFVIALIPAAKNKTVTNKEP